MLNVSRYFNTLCHLRPIQIYARLWHRLYKPTPDLSAPPALRPLLGAWHAPARKPPNLIAANRFRFLNEENDLVAAADWNHPDRAKLWLYNLHYFDDLNAAQSTERLAWHRSLMTRWIAENSPGHGNGWEPYPLSLRIVNWVKWALAGNSLPDAVLHSLAVQARYLAGRIEYHLLGNHLLANAKALVFAGILFDGNEAAAWLEKGLRILRVQLPEQVLADGGHFERSPMYHSIVFEDILDLINLLDGRETNADVALFRTNAGRMLAWMNVMRHPDGQIALFNDAAFGVAAHPAELAIYAEKSGVHQGGEHAASCPEIEKPDISRFSTGDIWVVHLKASGYLRVENGPMTAFLDAAPIGPDYLPGHAHADTLTLEMSLHGQRVIVDSGTSRYDEGLERLHQRGTTAHNSVVIDGRDSSEVWGGFRVARRAKPFGLVIKETAPGYLTVRCAHDGYRRLPGRPVHWREWHFHPAGLKIHDKITGSFPKAVSRLHFHPEVELAPSPDACETGIILLPDGRRLRWQIQKGGGRLTHTTYHPEFGVTISNRCLEILFDGHEAIVDFTFSNHPLCKLQR